jgi:hypothetical protein
MTNNPKSKNQYQLELEINFETILDLIESNDWISMKMKYGPV